MLAAQRVDVSVVRIIAGFVIVGGFAAGRRLLGRNGAIGKSLVRIEAS